MALMAFTCLTSVAQSYIINADPSGMTLNQLRSDTRFTSVILDKGASVLESYHVLDAAAEEYHALLKTHPDAVLHKVYVFGGTSPEGLWADNVELSQSRTDEIAAYLKSKMNISDEQMEAVNLKEDWRKLLSLVVASEMPSRNVIADIIWTKSWGERKSMLKELEGGRVWEILEKEYFPQLRGVRFAIFCTWDATEEIVASGQETVYTEIVHREVVPHEVIQPEVADSKKEEPSNADTVAVRDSLAFLKEQVKVSETLPVQLLENQMYPQSDVPESVKKEWDTPWMMGFKTNLAADAVAIPNLGVEFQLARFMSLDLQAYVTAYNLLVPDAMVTGFYNFSPELRFWVRDGGVMRKGSFFGIYGSGAWYTLHWKDGLLYQNADNPAWSAGLAYGYSIGLGRKAHWGLEFVVGVGYSQCSQNLAKFNAGVWELVEHHNKRNFGLTRVGLNLTYRFSLRRVNDAFYDSGLGNF